MQPRTKQTVVHTYRARSRAAADALFARDAETMSQARFTPVSAAWSQASWGAGAYLLAFALSFVLVGIVLFIDLLLVKPSGRLTVTYERQPDEVAAVPDEVAAEPAAAEPVAAVLAEVEVSDEVAVPDEVAAEPAAAVPDDVGVVRIPPMPRLRPAQLGDPMAALTTLAEMRDRGRITSDEFETRKAGILARL